ncbi:YbhB/YbcL family Raf kinase inhibitor-like protein [Trinickia dabaoshanensis]|uniref:YbhB/YbcL family Raf kinase inhibitor-like protein n=1 Tax=Trinickia dabaoshanensis TaxID=564714 RepID=A0A2N7VVX8_9BURK|nr:YbhB/YbcL family Raf kinase inhibitor-like protein [Trinickia dabaoshanensis]
MLATGNAKAQGLTIDRVQLTNDSFDNAQVSGQFGCHGQNVSPSIRWSGEPDGTRSYLLTMRDADAPTGSGFWHWVVADIPASVHAIATGAGNDASQLPEGALAVKNDLGHAGYLGPCPPQGETHRYIVTLTALKIAKLPVDANATPAVVGFVAHYQALAQATATIRMKR